jgi:anti-repressor protein
LQVKQRFLDWITKRIEQYGFEEDRDFTRYYRSSIGNPKPLIEYYLTFDMCKEVSMVEKTAKGKEARQYCLECERRLKAKEDESLSRGDMLVRMAEAYRDQERRLRALEAQERARDKALIETQAKAIDAFLTAQHADTKADLALEDAHRMTIEEWVMHNGLLHQLPVSSWKRISDWLRPFCLAHGLKIEKAAVPGKLWPEENTYPLVAFGAWWRSELKRPTQVHLVPTPPAETTPQ